VEVDTAFAQVAERLGSVMRMRRARRSEHLRKNEHPGAASLRACRLFLLFHFWVFSPFLGLIAHHFTLRYVTLTVGPRIHEQNGWMIPWDTYNPPERSFTVISLICLSCSTTDLRTFFMKLWFHGVQRHWLATNGVLLSR
jgi:hypothetical protein